LKAQNYETLSKFAFNFNLRRYTMGPGYATGKQAEPPLPPPPPPPPGRAVQVEPMKSMLKAPGIKRLKLEYDEPLSNFAFKFNLRRYSPRPAQQ